VLSKADMMRQKRKRMTTPLPIVVGLKERIARLRPGWGKVGYRPFTTAFDEIVDVKHLAALLPALSITEEANFGEAVDRFDKAFSGERVEIAATGAAFVRDIQDDLPATERAELVVSLLIDHSGSMRGLRMMSALLAVEGAVDALAAVGISNEILGFTTASWKGGQSRRAWHWAGRPRNPGRLCDLRHLIYGAADRTTHDPWHLRMALRADLLHENIDGEALLWAASRLAPTIWKRRIICVVSDGAPVDDSTLLANDDQSILARHLDEAEAQLVNQGFIIATLMLGGEHYRQPAIMERAEEPQAAGAALIRLLRRVLLP
jgi:cobaltochelatase CobT